MITSESIDKEGTMSDWDLAVEMGLEDGFGNTFDDRNVSSKTVNETQPKRASIIVELTSSDYLSTEGRYVRAKLINNELAKTDVKLEILQDKLNSYDPMALEVFCNQVSIGYIKKHDNSADIDKYCYTKERSRRGMLLSWSNDCFVLDIDISDSRDLLRGQIEMSNVLEKLDLYFEEEDWVCIPKGKLYAGYAQPNSDDPSQRSFDVDSFEMLRTPVTFAMYDVFCEHTGIEKPHDMGWGRGNRPVVNVSYWDAVEYCMWLSRIKACEIRLPTEVEWEYACRSGTDTLYNYGDKADFTLMHVSQEYGKTKPVGTFPPNGWGLFDMHGNVLEWCSNIYCNEPKPEFSGKENTVSDINDDTERPLRGGHWWCDSKFLDYLMEKTTSAGRMNDKPSLRSDEVGFRLLRKKPSSCN